MNTVLQLAIMMAALSFLETEARHIHGRERHTERYDIDGTKLQNPEAPEYTVRAVDIMNMLMTPYRLAPLNREFVFKMDEPCKDEGFKRDITGICREVWD